MRAAERLLRSSSILRYATLLSKTSKSVSQGDAALHFATNGLVPESLVSVSTGSTRRWLKGEIHHRIANVGSYLSWCWTTPDTYKNSIIKSKGLGSTLGVSKWKPCKLPPCQPSTRVWSALSVVQISRSASFSS